MTHNSIYRVTYIIKLKHNLHFFPKKNLLISSFSSFLRGDWEAREISKHLSNLTCPNKSPYEV